MASAKKLKSGSWRVQANKVIDGVMHRKSFTVSPDEFPGIPKEASKRAKAQAELLARNWLLEAQFESNLMTIEKALDVYIEKKEPVLSDSTIAGYMKMLRVLKKNYDSFLKKDIKEITSKDIQSMINTFIADGASSKTIKNRIGLILAALDFSEIEKKFKYTIPKTPKPVLNPPEPSEFHRLLSMASAEDKLIIILAGLYTLRRGEIAALQGEDILWDFNSIYVHASRVQDKNNKWVRRPMPKTKQSERIIKVDPEIIKLFPKVGKKEFVISLNPNEITKHFEVLRKKACVDCRLHDLRKYAASIRSELMPAKYIEAEGGWSKNSNVLSTIYDKPFKEKRSEYSKLFNKKIVDEYKDELFN